MARIGSGGTAAGLGAHINIATPPIWKFGSEEQKQRYLVPAIRGERIGALGITEPGAGSDVAALATRAERVDGGWVLHGEKTYITNGVRAHFIVTAARTTAGGRPRRDLLLDRRPRRGRQRGEAREARLARLRHRHDRLQDVFVPEQNLLGELDGGFKLIMANFQWERLAMALGAVGAMQLAWERTAEFARERKAFGRPLSGHQAIRHKLADLATSLYTCRCVTYDALRRFVAGEDPLQGGHDGQAADPARVLRADGRLPADPRGRRLHARVLRSSAPPATPASARSAAAATRSCARSSGACSPCSATPAALSKPASSIGPAVAAGLTCPALSVR